MMLAMALFFALLQPFLHIHLDKDHPIQQTGFHIANAYEKISDEGNHTEGHLLPHSTHSSEIISIDSSFKKEVDLSMSADNIAFAIILFCISLAILSPSSITPHFQPHFYRFLKRRLPASRAPPKS